VKLPAGAAPEEVHGDAPAEGTGGGSPDHTRTLDEAHRRLRHAREETGSSERARWGGDWGALEQPPTPLLHGAGLDVYTSSASTTAAG
jgi:hypothetical protein